MKHLFSLLFIFYFVLGQSQTTIPIVGFKGTINSFPIVSNDTIMAKVTLLDISNQFTGNNLTGRDSLVLWKNCKRYRVDTIMTAFATSVNLKLLKEGNPNLTPGVCAFIEETVGNKSFAPAGITDGERQCINAYYVGNDSLSILDTIFINDSLYYVLNGDTINAGKFSSIDTVFIDSDSLYYVSGTDTINVGYIPTEYELICDTLYAFIIDKGDIVFPDGAHCGSLGYIDNDIYYFDGAEWVLFHYQSRIFTTSDYEEPDSVSSPRKYDIFVGDSGFEESYFYNGSGWEVFDYDANTNNEGLITFDNFSTYRRASFRSNTNAFARKDLVGDSTIFVYNDDISGTIKFGVDTSWLGGIISDSLSTYVFETDTALIRQIVSDSINTIVFPSDSTNVLNSYGTIITESPANTFNIKVDSSKFATPYDISLLPNQTLSQSFSGSTEATYTLSNSGGSVKDTTGYMRLETMDATVGQRLYRYKSNLGSVMGMYEGAGTGNIEILRSGNIMSWGLRTDNASNGQYYKFNGTSWALATAPTGTVTSVGLGLGTSGTDANISSSPITSSGTITLNLPTSSASNRGLLNSADWTTFNDKLGTVTDGTTIDFTKSGANITGEAIGLNYFFNAWNTKPSRFQYNIASTNGPTGGNVYGYTVPHTVSGYDWQMASDGSAGGLFYRGTNAGSTLGWEDVYSTYKPPKNLAYASDMSANWSTVTSSSTRYFKYMYANTNSPDGNTWYGLHVPHGANDTYAWQLAGQGGDLYYRGKEGGAYSSWSEIIKSTGNAVLSGTGARLVGTTSGGDLNTLTLGTGLSISGTTINGPSIPETWANISNHVVSWGSTGTFGSGYPVAVGVTSATQDVDINGHIRLRGAIYNSSNSSGTSGHVLTSQGAGSPWIWAAPSAGAFTVAANGTAGSQVITTDGTPVLNFNGGVNIEVTRSVDDFTFRQKSPYTMLAVNTYSKALTTTYSKLVLTGQSSTNGDGTDINFDNTNNEIDILTTGTYHISYKCNCKSNTSSVNVIFDLLDNSTSGTLGTVSTHYFNNTNEFSHNNMEWNYPFTAGDSFSLYAKTASGTTTITDCNIRVFAERVK